ncbi:hypothetical protein PN36_29015 [Candidatus Thiomargarita nelsonii]|uniref:N-acetyltransferase domain-containing protein n=1 Tax=Candidatus Thiomargarita nelsonii TaxID=1003181 RepID=A0A0A6PBQ9_9GAMM|nr:hypothetical protein PN36_29015 [Candidatus Thiomargarita nelsonii]
MNIRESLNSDLESIRNLHLEAFGEEENEEVSKLALDLASDSDSSSILSLVAVEEGAVIGHVVFSPISISNNDNLSGFILAPLAVSPSEQKQGVGSKLIQFGFDTLAKNDVDAVFVLGDPNYYSRSGFHTDHDVNPPYSLPYPEAWQAKELKVGALQGVSGTVECVSVLMPPELW